MITVGKLESSERAAWETLFRGYIAFYQREEPQEMYDGAWDEFQADTRGRGVARALIGAVADWASTRGCSRVYWHTHESNVTARALYDKVAQNRGFIRYQIELTS
jgi:GNAT superfamily N-acetyltransferase